MKKNLFYLLFAALSAVVVFASCKDDEGNTSEQLMANVAGTYDGKLNVSLDGTPIATDMQQRIYIESDGNKSAQLSLIDFSIAIGGSSIEVGDIIVPGVALEGDAVTVNLQETTMDLQHESLGNLKITLSGSIVNLQANLHIVVFAETLNQNIDVTFSGERTSAEIDNTDYAKLIAGWYDRENLTATSQSGDELDLTYPSDGFELTYAGKNKLNLVKFFLSYPPRAEYVIAEGIKVQKEADGSLTLGKVETETTPYQRTYRDKKIFISFSGTVKNEKPTLNITLKIEDAYDIEYVLTGGVRERVENELLRMTFENNTHIAVQPEISGKNVFFYTTPDATSEDLKQLVPTFEVSEGATVLYNDEAYVEGTAIDFSGESTRIKVQSEKGVAQTYTIKHGVMAEASFKVDFNEPWELKNETSDENNKYQEYYEPGNGWATSNEGLKWVKMMYGTGDDALYPQDGEYLVTETDDAVSGKAARIMTADTKGRYVWITSVPKVTSGSVYNGVFSVSITNTLKSTHFGDICRQEPKSFKGYYKYAAGENYYQANTPGDPTKAHDVTLDNSKKDTPALNAVLYEVEAYSADYLDGTNLLTSDKIVAIASVEDAGEQSDYKEFNVGFKYKEGKSWDTSKKYKLAIVCSSSKDGDKFSGAPGSVLYVDDLEVTF